MQAVKKSSKESRDGIDDELSEITRKLQMGDFVWIEHESSEVSCEDQLDSSHEHTTDSNGVQECLQYNADDTESQSEWERDVLVDQWYWERHDYVTQKENSPRIKCRTTQRLTVKQQNNIDHFKSIDRDPSCFKFDINTTAALKTLIDQRYVGPLHNVVSSSKNAVIIHASNPENSAIRTWFSGGIAVKVYKMTKDAKQNVVILRRAQREYENLLAVKNMGHVVSPVNRIRNVLVSDFIGRNHETTPCITKIAPQHLNTVYQIVVGQMKKWYIKCNIVHRDLCPKNILFVTLTVEEYYYKTPFFLYVIGWGHSVKKDHPRALMKLMRDCHVVTNFFRRRNVPVMSSEDLFKNITGLHKISSKLMEGLHKKDLWQNGHLTNPNR